MSDKIIPQSAIDRARRGVLAGRQYPREFPHWLIFDTLHPDERFCCVPDDGVLSLLASADGTPFELAARVIRDPDTGNVVIFPQKGWTLATLVDLANTMDDIAKPRF